MRTFITILILSTMAMGQATYRGSGRSSGNVTYSTKGTPGGGGGVTTNENLYCPAAASGDLTEGIPTWGVSDGIALLPTRCMNTALTSTPSPGTTIAVAANDSAGFATAINTVTCGQTITLSANSTYTGTFTFPDKSCDGGHWITIRSTGITDPLFPPEGVRATPCIMGISNDAINGYGAPGYPSYACPSFPAVLSAQIKAPASGTLPAIQMTIGASHYRFIGIEIVKTFDAQTNQLIQTSIDGLTQGANHVVFDRVVCHGQQWLPTSGTGSETQGCINANNSQWIAVVNSYGYDTYCNSSCVDSQVFQAGTGAVQDGPFKLYNNMVATSGESFALGGGGQGPAIATPVTQDFEIRANHSFSPLTWMTPVEQTGLYPNVPTKKNLGEFKNGQRILLEGNFFENTWLGNSDQDGIAVIIGAKNQNKNDQVPLTANGTAVVTAASCSASGCTPNFSPDMLDATNCSPTGCVLEVSNIVYRICNGSNGCDQTGTSMDAGTPCVLGTDIPLHSSCVDMRIYVDPSNPTASFPTGSIAYSSVFACHPGKCSTCKVQHVTFRLNEIYNVINGIQIATGRSSHCLDESAGTSNISVHDNLTDGLSIQMTDGSDPDSGSSAVVISSGQFQNVIANIDVIHNTFAFETGNPTGQSGFGNQIDHTDIRYLSGLNNHDNISPAPWFVSHTQGSIVAGGLAAGWQTDACSASYPTNASTGFIPLDGTQSFTFSPIPGGLSYIVTLNGVIRPLTAPTTTSFTLAFATHAGDAISIRDLTQCNWTFRSNLLGTGPAMPGAGVDQSPYPDGTVQASANNTIACGPSQTLTCLLNETTANPLFTSNFIAWTGRRGNYNLLSGSAYFGTATDAGSRASTGLSPGADLTLLGTTLTNVASSTFIPTLTITSGTLTPSTHNVVYRNLLTSSNGASQFWAGYKSWFLVVDPALCAGNCGVLPSTSGIVIGRGGTINGDFMLNVAKRAVQACGTAGTVACSTFTVKQSIVAGSWQVGQIVTLSNFENGTGNAVNDATFNGSCAITIATTSTFSCAQTGTGADTIASHNPNSLWQGVWKNATSYLTTEQVTYNSVIYSALQNGSGHQPDTSPTFWSVVSTPNFVPAARVAFAPITAGTYQWWMGARDGAFQLAYKQITLVVN